jgi:hypothetical protein
MSLKLCPSFLREECGLKIFENSMLRRLFGPKRDERNVW